MYTSHFGLLEAPFSITPDPQYLYMSERHREALAHLVYGIGEAGGFVVLTGEVGTGKTTICRCLLKQLPPNVDVALVLNPKVTALELLASVCDELRLPYPPDTTSLKVLVDLLYRYVLEAHERGRRTVLIIDEAQNLSAEALEQVRLLTNLETAKEKLLQVILIGQPELVTALERPELRQLAQRITARYHLQPLAPHETHAYIAHRLEIAGRKKSIFRPSARREVHRLSKGIPRLINVMCDRALLGAYSADRRTIDRSIVRKAAREVLGRGLTLTDRRGLVAASVLVLAVMAGAGALVWARAPGLVPRLLRSAEEQGPPAAMEPAPPRTTAVVTATSTPAPSSGAAALALREVLSDPAVPSDKASAFASLYARWGLDVPRKPEGLGCERARENGLRCLVQTGTWNKLRRFDMPAILELTSATGDKRYATVVGAGDDSATLAFGTREITVPLREIDQAWDGPFIVLWRPPVLSAPVIEPGARGKDVQWLRLRLDEIAGTPGPPRSRDVYDVELQRRVMAFQRSRSLVPDAIVGEETLAQLSVSTRGDGRPSLTAR